MRRDFYFSIILAFKTPADVYILKEYRIISRKNEKSEISHKSDASEEAAKAFDSNYH
jgi:hypothetical protein